MDNSVLYSKFNALPEQLKKEVEEFIDKLLAKKNKQQPNPTQRTFGAAKGMLIMHDDFDEPLDEFKEYMPE
jgi:hypothetical protein